MVQQNKENNHIYTLDIHNVFRSQYIVLFFSTPVSINLLLTYSPRHSIFCQFVRGWFRVSSHRTYFRILSLCYFL